MTALRRVSCEASLGARGFEELEAMIGARRAVLSLRLRHRLEPSLRNIS